MRISRQYLSFAITCWLLAVPAFTIVADSPDWVQLGQRLKASSSAFVDIDASRHAFSPSLANSTGSLYLTWLEFNDHGISQVHVKYWKEENWITLGDALNIDPTHQAYDAVMAMAGSIPYVVWIELNKMGTPQLHGKHWTSRGWVSDGENLNHDLTNAAANPSMATDKRGSYLTWTERNEKRVYQVYVKSLTENGWVHLGDSLNEDPSADAIEPSIVVTGSTPYIAWCEKGANGTLQVYVKHWTGEAWIRDGESLNKDPLLHALSPSIASNETVPYVAWVEFDKKGISQVYVKHWANNKWIQDGDSLNVDPNRHALSPSLAFIGNSPYVAWAEPDPKGISQIHVKRWTGSDWIFEGKGLNLDLSRQASAPAMATVGGRPYLAWKEADETGLFNIIVKMGQ